MTYEEKLLAWRRAWVRVCREQEAENEREADRSDRMTPAQIKAFWLAEYGSAALAERASLMCMRGMKEVIQKFSPTRH